MQVHLRGSVILSITILLVASTLGRVLIAAKPCAPTKLLDGHITGVVIDLATGEALNAVNVSILGTSLGTATSTDGRFSIVNVPQGSYTILVSHIGHEEIRRPFSIANHQTVTLDFGLRLKPIEFDEIVVQRTSLIGTKERMFKIPGSAHYLGSEDLAKFEYNDVHRALREVPGINIQEEDGYGLRPNIGFRGTGSERSSKITVMEDGILQAPAPYSAPAAYFFPTVGRMSAIEVRKGSSQIKYGPYTTGGALNFISTPIPDEFDGYLEIAAGEDEHRRIHAVAGNSFRNFSFLAETFQAKTDGFKELDGGGNTGFDKKDYLIKFRFNTDPGSRVYQQLSFKLTQTDETSNETYLGLTDNDFELNHLRRYAASQKDVMQTEQRQALVRHFVRITQSVDFTTSVYRTEFQRNWYKLDRIRASQAGPPTRIADVLADPQTFASEYAIAAGQSSSNGNALEVKANNRDYYAWGLQTQAVLRFKAVNQIHEAELGVRYHEDQIDRFQWVDLFGMENGIMELTQAGIHGAESNRISKAKVWATYAELTLNFGKLTAVPGLRYEHISLARDDFGDQDPMRTGSHLGHRENEVDVVIPGIGIDYKISSNLSTFIGIHRGFAPPGSKEGTKPEKSINYEIGARLNSDDFGLQSVVFFNDYSNLLGSDFVASGGKGSGDQFNGGEVDVKGLELSLNYDLAALTGQTNLALPVRAAYTFTDAKFTNHFDSDFEAWGSIANGDELPYVPKQQLFLEIGLEMKVFSAVVGAKYSDRMRTVAGQGDFPNHLSTDAHWVFDLSADFPVADAHKFFVAIRNLSNAKYVAARRPAGARPGLPRTLLAGIKTSF